MNAATGPGPVGRPAAEPPLVCPAENHSGVNVLRPAGTLSLGTVQELRSVLLKSLSDQPTGIVIDMRGLEIADDVCLTVFAAVAHHAAAWPGCRLVAAALPDVAARLRAFAIDRHLTITETLPDALENARIGSFGPLVREQYAPRLASVGAARAFAGDACAGWGLAEHTTLVVRLVVTELVGNAVRHAGTRIDLDLRLTSRYVHVAVRDRDRRPPRLVGPDSPASIGGRGLLLVDALTTTWGSTPTEDGKVAWATVRHTGA